MKEMKKQIRAIKSSMEDRYGQRIDERHPVLTWVARHAAETVNRFRIYSDGKSALQRLTGRKWKKPCLVYGECVMVQPADDKKRDYQNKLVLGVYVGHSERSGSLKVLTEDGAVTARSFKQLPAKDRFKIETLEKAKGLPWDMRQVGDGGIGRPPRATGAEAQAGPPLASPPPVPDQVKGAARDFYITRPLVEEFGSTEGCKACLDIVLHGRTRFGHSTGCRNRFKAEMAETPEGKLRLEAADRRRKLEGRQPTEGGAGEEELLPAPEQPREVREQELQRVPEAEELRSAPTRESERRAPDEREWSQMSADERRAAKMATKQREKPQQGEKIIRPASKARGEPSVLKRPATTAAEELDPRVDPPGGGTGSSSSAVATTSTALTAVPTTLTSSTRGESEKQVDGGKNMDVNGFAMYKKALTEQVRERFQGVYGLHGMGEQREDVKELAELAVSICAVDVAEVYSPARFQSQCKRLGLRAGFAVDMTTEKPNGDFWDLRRAGDVELLRQLQDRYEPEVLIGCPPCTVFSSLRRLSNYKRNPGQVQAERAEGVHHLQVCFDAYRRHIKMGKFFLHEHPIYVISVHEVFHHVFAPRICEPWVFT